LRIARPAVFFDRDGVLNQAVLVDGRPHPPQGEGELLLEDGAADACKRLREAGVPMVVITNQPDIARGTVSRETVDHLNGLLKEMLLLDAVYVCPHDDGDGCDCRKPAPGMLFDAARDLGLDLSRSVMVGDRWKDVEAGRKAGCATVFVDRGYRERGPDGADLVVKELPEAVNWILARVGAGRKGEEGLAITH
jgi:D-glycero-D-manno-heptose 1,7-bisphosphate phosphatase